MKHLSHAELAYFIPESSLKFIHTLTNRQARQPRPNNLLGTGNIPISMKHKTLAETFTNSGSQSSRAAVNSDLAWEAKACSDTRHSGRDEVVEVTVGRCGQLQSAETDVIQSLVVNAVSFIRVLNELMHGQSCIVRLHDCVRHLYNTATASAGV